MVEFGISLPQQGVKYGTIKEICQKCEKLNFDTAWLADHFHPFPPFEIIGAHAEPVLECWVTLSALFRDTKSLRIGSSVTCISYRYPSLLAKMAATVDEISDGRLEFGIGAGWREEEYIAYGIPFPETPVRIKQLREALQIIKLMWTQEKATFKGDYYQIKDAYCAPKPVQKPHPPIMIGAEGNIMLKVVAEYADVWNFAADIRQYTSDEYKRKIEILERHCSKIGRSPNEIKKTWLGVVLIAQDRQELRKKTERFKPKDTPIDYYSRGRIIGTPEECIEKLRSYIDAGANAFELVFPDILEMDCLELFAHQVIPALKNS